MHRSLAIVAAIAGLFAFEPAALPRMPVDLYHLPPAWVGVFRPSTKLDPSPTRAIVGREGEVVALTPSRDQPPQDQPIQIVQPLVGMNVRAALVDNRAKLALFAIDRRPGADAVLILPGQTPVVFVEPSKADIVALRSALMRNEVLSGVKRALADLEVGAIDVDGDRKADFAITYGCNVWADGQCQGHGEFLLVRHGTIWVELE